MTKAKKANVVYEKNDQKKLDGDALFWGLLLVALGALFLLNNLGVLNLYLSNIFQLWPLIIIGIGISFLSLRGAWGVATKAVVIIASLALIAFTITNEHGLRAPGDDNITSQVQVAPASDEVKELDLRIKTGAMSVVVGSEPRDSLLVDATVVGGSQQLRETTERDSSTQRTTLETSGFRMIGSQNRLNLQLARDMPMKLSFDTGASAIKGDLSQLQLTNLDIDTGVSAVDLRLGDIQDTLHVSIDVGVSSVTLHVPHDVAYQVKHDGGLSSGSFDGTEKVDKETHETEGFNSSKKRIIIQADTGVSSFKVVRY